MRWIVRVVGAALLLLTLAWIVLHWLILPRIDEFRPRLEAWASRAVAAPVTIGGLRAESNGLVPSVSLHDVQVHDPAGRAGLRIPRVLAAFSVLSLARANLEQLVIDGPDLELRRTAGGRLLVGGLDLSGDAAGDTRVADWFFSLTEFLVLDGRVRWIDEKRGAAPLSLSRVRFVARNAYGRHQLRLDATPDVPWGEHFELMGQFRQPVLSTHPGYWRDWEGRLFARFNRIDVARLRQSIEWDADWGVDLRRGQGALRAWGELRKGVLTGVTADLALTGVEAAFAADLEPLTFASFSGRLGWRQRGGAVEVDTQGLQFRDADGVVWPGGNFQLSFDQAPTVRGGGQLRGDRLDLAALAKIALRLPLPAGVHERLRAHPVAGMVERLDASWRGALDAPTDWRLRSRVTGLSIGARPAAPTASGEPVEGMPGIEGAALEVDATPAGGRGALEVRDGALEFPGVFEEPRLPMSRLSARAQWRVRGERIEVDVDELKVHNPDASGTFKAHWHTAEVRQPGDRRFPGVLDLQGRFDRANGARIHRYLPFGVAAPARRYVREAIRKGEARDVSVRVKGNLLEVPFEKSPAAGEFRFAGRVHDVEMVYVPRSIQPGGQLPWPALARVSGELVFDRNSMQLRNASAQVEGHPGWQFSAIQASIADFGQTRVLVQAQGRGALPVALGMVRRSPLAAFTRHALDRAEADGHATVQLRLDLPVERIAQAAVEGQLGFEGNRLQLTPDTPALQQLRGAVTFSDTGFALKNVQAQLLGGTARLAGGLPPKPAGASVQVQVSGTATAEALRKMRDWGPVAALARQASGSAAYNAVVDFGDGQPDMLVTSDLRGMAFDLPAPLAKPAEAAWPLRYESRTPAAKAGESGRERLRVSVSDVLALDYEREPAGPSARVLRGALALGSEARRDVALPASGILARIELPRLDADAWQAMVERLWRAGAPDDVAPVAGDALNSYLPTAWTVRLGELLFDQRVLHEVASTGTRDGMTWRADVHARELAGRIDYSEGNATRPGRIHARLRRLSMPAAMEDEPPLSLADPPARIPALDVVVDEFQLAGKSLGRLRIEAVNRDLAGPGSGQPGRVNEWQLSRLALDTPEATLTATGRWAAGGAALPVGSRSARPANDPRRTELDFKLELRDAGALLTRLAMPDVLARGKGQLTGQLGWVGSPFAPHYPSMDGSLRVEVGAGQFLKADPGIAKLLGVLSLQALPRRLTLDFRDLFSAGFAFDAVRGDVTMRRGVASTNNLQMKGVNAAVLMEGSADIVQETQDLRVLVVPEIDAGTAALAATVINPAIGIGAFLAQLVLKRPLVQAATREFHIGGSWDNPQITPVGARAGPAAAGPEPARQPDGAPADAPPAPAPPDPTKEAS